MFGGNNQGVLVPPIALVPFAVVGALFGGHMSNFCHAMERLAGGVDMMRHGPQVRT